MYKSYGKSSSWCGGVLWWCGSDDGDGGRRVGKCGCGGDLGGGGIVVMAVVMTVFVMVEVVIDGRAL